MRQNNKTCLCCKKTYSFCTGCSAYDHLPRWMAIFHDENCKKLFNATTDYLAGEITEEEVKAIFDTCDLSDKANFHHSIQELIAQIYGNGNKAEVKADKLVETVPELAKNKEVKAKTVSTKMEYASRTNKKSKKEIVNVD